jgi:hypothetical protein
MPVIRTAPGPADLPRAASLTLVAAPGEVDAVTWEPCASAHPAEPGEPVCERCGWLTDEHPDGAPVHLRLAS